MPIDLRVPDSGKTSIQELTEPEISHQTKVRPNTSAAPPGGPFPRAALGLMGSSHLRIFHDTDQNRA
jgi:hypothetical protein